MMGWVMRKARNSYRILVAKTRLEKYQKEMGR
jgi:hypothetical protein